MTHFKAIFALLALTFTATPSAYAYPEFGKESPKELWSSVNSGWSGIYADLNAQLDGQKNYVVWSMIAPKKPLDLRKPDFFREFLSNNSSKSLSISHNLVGWSCNVNGQRFMGATGQSGERTGQTAKLVKAGYGLTTFLATFHDGWLSPAFITPNIWEERGQKEEIYNLVVEVSESDCSNMLGFLKKFIFHKNNPTSKFGLAVDPEKFEGGGCISFASALLKKAGVLNKMLDASERKLWASHYRFGGNDLPLPESTTVPRISWREGQQRRIGLNNFFSNNWNAGLQGVELPLPDPELMIWGLKSLDPAVMGAARKVQKYPNPQGGCRDNPRPQCDYHVVSIDDKFDGKAARVSVLAKSWKKGMLARGYSMDSMHLRGKPFVIFRKD